METNGKVCCFTGYRPHRFGFSPNGLRPEQVKDALFRVIGHLVNEGYRTFISGMCLGVDMWAAEEVLAWKKRFPAISLVAAVPFEGQETHWRQADRHQYATLLAQCDHVEIVCNPEQAKKDAPACYRKRNAFMVDCADTVVAVFAPDTADARSGTAATVRYARRKMRRIVYIHPKTLQFSEETVHQLTFL